MRLPDLSYIEAGRTAEVDAVDGGCPTSEFTTAPRDTGLGGEVSEGEEESLLGRPVDDVMELDERVGDIPRYLAHARIAFRQRGLTYPFDVNAAGDGLSVLPGKEDEAVNVAYLSRIIRQGNPVAKNFERRAFEALQKWIGGWGVCVGAPRTARGMGPKKAVTKYRKLLLAHERGPHTPKEYASSGDRGADGFLILGRGWGGPIVFYQSKNTGFDLKSHPEEFARIPSISEDWFGKRVNLGRRSIPVVALNTVLTVELKERIFEERGESAGVHIIDAVDILSAECCEASHIGMKSECIVF